MGRLALALCSCGCVKMHPRPLPSPLGAPRVVLRDCVVCIATSGHGSCCRWCACHREQGQFEFVNAIIGNAIPPEYINAVKKGFEEALDKGPQINGGFSPSVGSSAQDLVEGGSFCMLIGP